MGYFRKGVDVDFVHVGDVDETVDAEKEEEVHLAASQPDDVSDVWDEDVIGRTQASDLWRAVGQCADVPSERVVSIPNVFRI